MADKPQNLNVVNDITSRAFSVTWSEPVNIYSSENLGYIAQLQDDNANMCVDEIIMRCNNCITGDIRNQDMPHCGQSLQVQIDQPHIEIRANKEYTFQSLLPDTNYTISVSVVTNTGKGHASSIKVKTLEEEPQAPPTAVTVTAIRKKSFNVSWSLIGPRPGQVTYTVILTAEMGAESKTYTVTGYQNTRVFADGLEEYWNYSVNVEAKTNVGNPKTSVTTHEYRTLPSAPGPVSEFGAATALHTDNLNIMTIQWKAPLLLEKNSLIKEYVLKHNVRNNKTTAGVSLENTSLVFESKSGDDFYSQEFYVTPDITYRFEVYAVNTERTDNIGQKTNITVTAQTPLINSGKDTSQTGMIVGIVIAVLVIVGVGVFVLFWIRRKKRKSQDSTDSMPIEKRARQYSAGFENDSNLVPDLNSITTKDESRTNVYENIQAGIQGNTHGQKYSSVFISGCCKCENDYIVCIAPKSNNVNDFWSMILSEEVDTIVMFAEDKTPKKESRYWPSEYNEPKNYGRITVEVTDLSTYVAHTHLKMSISSNGTSRTINHLQCSPVSTFSPDAFVELVKIVRSNHKTGRILLHSSEGLGSTVPFVVLDTCKQQLSDSSRTDKVDVYKMLFNIVKTHKELLLSQEMFIFSHDCVQLLGSCDYEPLQSTQIESVYQTLQVDD